MVITAQQKNIPSEIFSNPAYFGKHIVVLDNAVHVAITGDEAVRILEELRKQYPDKKPIIAYIPKDETLILMVWR